MSLYTSNASANRGACEQNCRREYVVTDKETGQQLEVDNNFIMSPTDLLTLDFMDQMVDAGIAVLKIEGRARSPEYVSAIVGAYRTVLDALEAGTYEQALVESLMPDQKRCTTAATVQGFIWGAKRDGLRQVEPRRHTVKCSWAL